MSRCNSFFAVSLLDDASCCCFSAVSLLHATRDRFDDVVTQDKTIIIYMYLAQRTYECMLDDASCLPLV